MVKEADVRSAMANLKWVWLLHYLSDCNLGPEHIPKAICALFFLSEEPC